MSRRESLSLNPPAGIGEMVRRIVGGSEARRIVRQAVNKTENALRNAAPTLSPARPSRPNIRNLVPPETREPWCSG